MMIPSDDILDKVIKVSEPKGGKNKKGFYYFQELLKKTARLLSWIIRHGMCLMVPQPR